MKKKQVLTMTMAVAMAAAVAVPACADGEKVKITYAQWGNEVETAATQEVADKFNSEQDKI